MPHWHRRLRPRQRSQCQNLRNTLPLQQTTGVLHQRLHRNLTYSAAKPSKRIRTTHAATFPGCRVRTFSLIAHHHPLTSPASSVTCPNSKQICATNTYFGVHGCCDPASLSACTIATTCIPSSAMSASCTNDACSTNNAIAKCTEGTATECYQWLFAYDSTTMTQHGCTATGFTATAQRSYGLSTTSKPSHITVTITASYSPATTPTSSTPPSEPTTKKQSLGPIIGGTLGGCTILSLVALTAFLIHRRRQQQHPPQPPVSTFHHTSPDFDPTGFHTGWSSQDIKTWQQSGGVHTPGVPYLGVSEVHGHDRAVEVEAPEKTKGGGWRVPGRAAVEVEAGGRETGGWRGAVEAPG